MLEQVRRKDLNVTKGSLYEKDSGSLTTNSLKFRAVEKSGNAKTAELRFRYCGPTAKTAPLASGTVVRQIGLKMRAKNTCNLLYVIWRIQQMVQLPDGGWDHRGRERVGVSLKRNPGKKYHNSVWPFIKGCGSNGYQTIADIRQDDPMYGFPSAKNHGAHILKADLSPQGENGYALSVHVDGKEIWTGTIAWSLLHGIDGPAGLRTDNGEFDFRLFTGNK